MARRPGSYTTFAIMNFIIGGILLICSVCSGIHPTVTINNQDATHQMIAFLNAQVPGYTVMKIGGAVAGFLFAAGLVVAGIGLLQGQTWGRVLAIIFSLGSALHHAFLIIFQVFWVNPALDRFFAGFPLFNLSIFPKTLAFGFIVFWALAIVYYLIECIMLAVTPPTVRGADDYDDERRRPRRDDYDDDDDRPRRRGSSRDDDYDDQPRSRRRPDDDDDYDDEPRRRRRP